MGVSPQYRGAKKSEYAFSLFLGMVRNREKIPGLELKEGERRPDFPNYRERGHSHIQGLEERVCFPEQDKKGSTRKRVPAAEAPVWAAPPSHGPTWGGGGCSSGTPPHPHCPVPRPGPAPRSPAPSGRADWP